MTNPQREVRGVLISFPGAQQGCVGIYNNTQKANVQNQVGGWNTWTVRIQTDSEQLSQLSVVLLWRHTWTWLPSVTLLHILHLNQNCIYLSGTALLPSTVSGFSMRMTVPIPCTPGCISNPCNCSMWWFMFHLTFSLPVCFRRLANYRSWACWLLNLQATSDCPFQVFLRSVWNINKLLFSFFFSLITAEIST